MAFVSKLSVGPSDLTAMELRVAGVFRELVCFSIH